MSIGPFERGRPAAGTVALVVAGVAFGWVLAGQDGQVAAAASAGQADSAHHSSAQPLGPSVRLVVDIGQAINDVAFWTGTPPNNLLVVISRDTRSGLARQIGKPSSSTLGSPPSEVATIVGTIEPVPYPEATFNWGLTQRDRALLAERGVYVEASELLSAAPDLPDEKLTATEVDEAGRETAPPPGDQVETPANLPPPLP